MQIIVNFARKLTLISVKAEIESQSKNKVGDQFHPHAPNAERGPTQKRSPHAQKHYRTFGSHRIKDRTAPICEYSPSPNPACLVEYSHRPATTDFMSNSSSTAASHSLSAQTCSLEERDIKSRCRRRRHPSSPDWGECAVVQKLSHFAHTQEYAPYVRSCENTFGEEASK